MTEEVLVGIQEKIKEQMTTEYFPLKDNKKLINKFLFSGILFLLICFIIFSQFVSIGTDLNNEISYRNYLLEKTYLPNETIKPFPIITYILMGAGVLLLLMCAGYFSRLFMGEYLDRKEKIKNE